MNTVHFVNGVAVGDPNGIAEAWVDRTRVLFADDILYRNNGTDDGALWTEQQTIRQGGVGYIWYDKWAAGNERIGCGGVIPGDTTAPGPPASLTAH